MTTTTNYSFNLPAIGGDADAVDAKLKVDLGRKLARRVHVDAMPADVHQRGQSAVQGAPADRDGAPREARQLRVLRRRIDD